MAAWSWSQLYAHRRNAAKQFGDIYHLPIVRKVREVVLVHVQEGDRVLEVGAGKRKFAEHLQARYPRVAYFSQDIDPQEQHDFRTLAEIQEAFDVVMALEVAEHLSVEELIPWLTQLREITKPGGRLVLSTPNTFYPPAYLRDVTHRTPLCYDELAALVTLAGWHVCWIGRIYHEVWWRKLLRRYLFGWLFRLIGLDFARQIMLVGQNETKAG